MKSTQFRLALVSGIVGVLAWLSPLPAPGEDRLWRNLGPESGSDVTGVALVTDYCDGGVAIYVTNSAPGSAGVRKSLDGGRTWIELGKGDPALSGATCLAIDPPWCSFYEGYPGTIYVGTAAGIVAKSLDLGATWTKTAIGTYPVSSIAIDPASTVYAGTRPVGYYGWWLEYGAAVSRSADHGGTWQRTSLGDRGVYALLADRLGLVLAGTEFAHPALAYGYGSTGGGVATSRNFGGTWTLPSVDLGFSVTALTRRLQDGVVLGATSSGQVLESLDDGVSWTPIGKLPGTVTALVVDPTSAPTMYASLLHGGVWRSEDGGASWRPFDAGLTDGSVRALVIDAEGRNLYAGTRAGLFHRELPSAPTGPCGTADDHLCLLESRFRVDLSAVDPHTGAPTVVKALSRNDRFGYFSLPSLTGDAALPEVAVKMLDATSLPGQGFWLFSTALTNVPYTLLVTDTTTGRFQLYDGKAFCGTADIQSFSAEAPASAPERVDRSRRTALPVLSTELALLSGRFRLTLAATDPETGNAVVGVAIPQDDRFGYFSLPSLTGDTTFPEVVVKMLDGSRLPDGDFWFFHAGLTSLPYTLTLADTVTGTARTYRNDPIDPARLSGGADTRVTTGPPPALLNGDWVATMYFDGDTAASVAQSGDRLTVFATTAILHGSSAGSSVLSSFDGALRGGSFSGVLRSQEGGCHFEADATAVATSSRILVQSEDLSGTCGQSSSLRLDLAPVR